MEGTVSVDVTTIEYQMKAILLDGQLEQIVVQFLESASSFNESEYLVGHSAILVTHSALKEERRFIVGFEEKTRRKIKLLDF